MIKSLLSSTINTRDLGGHICYGGIETKYNRFLRSDVPIALSEEDIQVLLENGITTIVDLRSNDEVKSKPCAFKENENFEYNHCKIYGDGRLPKSVELVSASYFEMVDDRDTMLKVMKTMANAKGGVLYHCTVGKDRTGVVTALLLLLVGVSQEEILLDYEISQEYLKDLLKLFCVQNKGIDINIITPKKEYMQNFLDIFNGKYGSVEEYLFKLGLDNKEVENLKEKLIK